MTKRTTLASGRVEEITIDAVTYDRLITVRAGGGEEHTITLACAGGYVRVKRGG